MKYINLTKGKRAIVDDEDFEYLNQYKWHCSDRYAYRNFRTTDGNRKYISMQRFIMNPPEGMEVDHINHNKLDNRKINLRICSHKENNRNRQMFKKNSSGYRGVYWRKDREHYKVTIEVEKKKIYLGSSKNIKDAAKMYNEAAKKYFGEFAYQNII